MPNVYHTPNIFLPDNDRRKIITQSTQQLPPTLPNYQEKRYHVTEEQMTEMRQLRKDNPSEWSVKKLSKKYDCSPVFVSFVTSEVAKEQKEKQKQVTDFVKSRWGIKRRTAREDRAVRKDRWFRDE
jgi:hypothetical protein